MSSTCFQCYGCVFFGNGVPGRVVRAVNFPRREKPPLLQDEMTEVRARFALILCRCSVRLAFLLLIRNMLFTRCIHTKPFVCLRDGDYSISYYQALYHLWTSWLQGNSHIYSIGTSCLHPSKLPSYVTSRVSYIGVLSRLFEMY